MSLYARAELLLCTFEATTLLLATFARSVTTARRLHTVHVAKVQPSDTPTGGGFETLVPVPCGLSPYLSVVWSCILVATDYGQSRRL
jgi:hypothetical protein